MIELVKRWGDPRLVGFLLDQLRANRAEPNIASRTMATIAEIIDDKDIKTIAEKYGEIAYEDDADIVESESEIPDKTGVESPTSEPENVPDSDEAEKPLETDTASAEPADETAGPKKATYKELRDEILAKFVASVERVMAEKEKDSKAER